MGARREGGCWGGPAPESWDLPPTLPRNGLAHSLGRAGQGRAGRAAQRVKGLGTWQARRGRSRLTSGGQAGSRGGLGRSRAGEVSPGPGCLPLPHLLGRLSVTRGGRGGPGGGRPLIGPRAEAGGADQPRLRWARGVGAGAGAGRRALGRKHAQPVLPTPSRRIASRLGQLAQPGPGPPQLHPAPS